MRWLIRIAGGNINAPFKPAVTLSLGGSLVGPQVRASNEALLFP
jgi:hypothetical protein